MRNGNYREQYVEMVGGCKGMGRRVPGWLDDAYGGMPLFSEHRYRLSSEAGAQVGKLGDSEKAESDEVDCEACERAGGK